jgi:hypothetical protein
VQETQEIHLGVEHRFADRPADRQLRRFVKDSFGADLIKNRFHFLAIADINDMQSRCRRKVLPAAAAEIVEDRDGVLSGEQCVDDMASDKARPTRYQNPHSTPLSRELQPPADEQSRQKFNRQKQYNAMCGIATGESWLIAPGFSTFAPRLRRE